MNYKKLVFFDVETTGLDPKEDRIIEIGVVVVDFETFQIEDEYELLINQHKEISEEITKLTGITNEMVEKNGIQEIELYYIFMQYHSLEYLLLAYNAQFDLNFVNEMCRRHSGNKDFFIMNDSLDVLTVYRDRHSYPHKLKHAIDKYNVEFENTHRAIDDIKATFEVFKAMSAERKNLTLYINRFGFIRKYGISYEKFPQIKYYSQAFNGCSYVIDKVLKEEE